MCAPIISANDLLELRDDPALVIADSRLYLDGRNAFEGYLASHVPGAVFVDVETALSATPGPGTGRHPLPGPEKFVEAMSAAGISDDSITVAYDDAGGVYAARLVWMLRTLGRKASLLDGGLNGWTHGTASGAVTSGSGQFTASAWPEQSMVTMRDVARLDDSTQILLDARSHERYCGEDPSGIDPRSGHIPGAQSLPAGESFDERGYLLPRATLLERFESVGVVEGGREVISSCGSGVTACLNLLLLEYCGLNPGRLYPGSWSQWSGADLPAVIGASAR